MWSACRLKGLRGKGKRRGRAKWEGKGEGERGKILLGLRGWGGCRGLMVGGKAVRLRGGSLWIYDGG